MQAFQIRAFMDQSSEFQTMAPIWWQEATIPHGSKMYRFQQRLKKFKQCLKLWNKQNFGNIFEAQRNLNDQMKLLQIQIRIKASQSNSKSRKH
jgi:hypothetical protein